MMKKNRTGASELAIQRVLNAEYALSGAIPSKREIQKRAGLAASTVDQYFDRAVRQIPGRIEVERAYLGFLREAGRIVASVEANPTDNLLRYASDARLTAERVATAIGMSEDDIRQKAQQLNLRLSETELAGSAPSRLTDEAVRSIPATEIPVKAAATIAGVSEPTWKVRVRSLRELAANGDSSGEAQSDVLPKADPEWQEESRRNGGTKLDESHLSGLNGLERAEGDQQHLASVDMALAAFGRDVIERAARITLQRAGRDPDEKVIGSYRDSGDSDDEVRSDGILRIDGARVPISAAYRVEADRIAALVAVLGEARSELHHGAGE